MASNFFEQQDIARKKTGRLVVLMVLAVVGIVVVTYPVFAFVFLILGGGESSSSTLGQPQPEPSLWDPVLFLGVSVVTLVIVSCSSLYKVAALKSGGGASVARSLGGRLLQPDTRDMDERKLMNVVEEMSIASGVPVPPVYLMDRERGINAFAAGYKPEDAVLGVTRGAIEQLTRDELQGVIAHEFSHILNGDMRLNIRLIGMIFGIVVIGLLGRIALRMAFYSSGGRGKKDGRALLVIIAVGVLLTIIGAVGVMFGRMIQAAVSRQREFLADASAVQFTRNPDGIGNALKRLGAHAYGTAVEDAHATEVSHMFFGQAVGSWMGGAMATHPPLPIRIKRVLPNWDGVFPEPRKFAVEPAPRKSKKAKGRTLPGQPGGLDVLGEGMVGAVVTGAVIADAAGASAAPSSTTDAGGGATGIEAVGQLDDEHIEYARELIGRIPKVLREAARQPYGARAVVFVVLLDRDETIRAKQLAHLSKHADSAVYELTAHLFEKAAHELERAARLPLVDLALSGLQQMSQDQYIAFRSNVDVLIEADERVDLFEWTLRRLLTRHLEAHLYRPRVPKVKYHALEGVKDSCTVVLSTLARVGSKDPVEIADAFIKGANAAELQGVALLEPKLCRLRAVGEAFDQLAHLSPPAKKALLDGCATTIAADGEITVGEGELMRAVADSLDCPMPPLLPGQKLI